METFKILKYRSPFGIYSEYNVKESRYKVGLQLTFPKVKLKVSEHNFTHKSIALWNSLIGGIIESNNPNLTRGYIVPGEKPNSDLSASIPFVKTKIKSVLLSSQSKGSAEIWDETNLAIFCYTK